MDINEILNRAKGAQAQGHEAHAERALAAAVGAKEQQAAAPAVCSRNEERSVHAQQTLRGAQMGHQGYAQAAQGCGQGHFLALSRGRRGILFQKIEDSAGPAGLKLPFQSCFGRLVNLVRSIRSIRSIRISPISQNRLTGRPDLPRQSGPIRTIRPIRSVCSKGIILPAAQHKQAVCLFRRTRVSRAFGLSAFFTGTRTLVHGPGQSSVRCLMTDEGVRPQGKVGMDGAKFVTGQTKTHVTVQPLHLQIRRLQQGLCS